MIVVSASRLCEQLINAPATMTVLTADLIGSAPSQNLTDLIRLVPGVNTVQTSARDVNITLPGAPPAHSRTQRLSCSMDGRSIRIFSDSSCGISFLSIPAQIKQIEVIRGPASAVWGANALEGVVNVITKTPREMAGTSASIQFGQFDRTRRGERFDGGGLFTINATHAVAPSDRFAYKVSGGMLTQEPLLRPVGHDTGD